MIWKRLTAYCLLAGLFCTAVQARDAGQEVYFYSPASAEKKIALTFDDGPHPYYTEEILEILDTYGIPATFFVIGVNAEAYPAQVQAILNAGHEIGNHSYDHINLQTQTYDVVRGEFLDMEEALEACSECHPHVFRPPGGLYGEEVCRVAAELQYRVILWSVDTRDWAHTPVEEIVENVLTNTDSGDIILFHDYVSGVSPTPEALRRILPVLIDRGYEFVTVSELLTQDGSS